MKAIKKETTTFCVKKLKVLADPARLSVLEILMQGPKRVWEIGEILGIEQSLLSHHLKVLREEGFVVGSREGKGVIYRISKQAMSQYSEQALNLGCCELSFDAKSQRSASKKC